MNIIAFAALAAAPILAPALAQNAAFADRVQIVRHSDLDLSKAADVRKLDRRIGLAVRRLCGPTSDADPQGKNDARRCRAATLQRLSARRESAIAAAAQPTRVALANER